jgi:membrane protease YdiL (CAAX protease family)
MQKPEFNKDFPNFWHALLLLFLLIALEGVIAVIFYSLGFRYQDGEPSSYAIVLLAIGIMTSLLLKYKNIGYPELFHFSNSSVLSTVIVFALPLALICYGEYYLLAEIDAYMLRWRPMSGYELNMFMRMMDTGFASFVIVCLVAPVVEEMLFRGLILRGFMNNYSAPKSILLSSFLFAGFHFNIYQFVTAFIIGCFLGWIYVKARSLWPCILHHSLFNTAVFVSWMSYEEANGLLAQPAFNTPVQNIIALLAMAFGVVIISMMAKPKKA